MVVGTQVILPSGVFNGMVEFGDAVESSATGGGYRADGEDGGFVAELLPGGVSDILTVV